jgi:hypothetical protein
MEVIFTRFDGPAFPKFEAFIEKVSQPKSPIWDPEHAALLVVLDNQSDKAITGLRLRWSLSGGAGQTRVHLFSSDSYALERFEPVVGPRSLLLLSPSASIGEKLADHVLAGGGMMGGGTSRRPILAGVVSATLEADLILFQDGEIAGNDPDRFAFELQCRQQAAKFIAEQIRLAEAEGRDVEPVLSALIGAPKAKGDVMARWLQRYAQDYLHRARNKIGTVDLATGQLRNFERRPELPKFYRRQQP